MRALADLEQPLEPRRPPALDFAEDHLIHDRVADDAGLGDYGRDVRDAARDVGRRQMAREDLDALDAVLERDDNGVWTDERRERGRSGVRVVHFHREEYGVDGADVRGRSSRVHVRHVKIALRTDDAQSAGAKRLEVRAARDERDVGAGRGQASAEVAAHAAAAEDGNLHGCLRGEIYQT